MVPASTSSSTSTLVGMKGRLPTGCRTENSGAMLNVWLLLCFLLVAMFGPLEVLAGEGGKVWSSTRFPKEVLGPDSWRYYRGQLSCLPCSLYLQSHLPGIGPMMVMGVQPLQQYLWSASGFMDPLFQWTQVGIVSASLLSLISCNNEGQRKGLKKLCMDKLIRCGFLPWQIIGKSLLEAAINAGASQNASSTGECGWFDDTVEVNATNLQVRSGTLHIGIFSDPKPTRTQSKMIPRGKKYGFGMGIQVFWCGTEALGGPDCNLGIDSLPPAVFLKPLNSMNTQLHDNRSFLSSRSSRNHLESNSGWSDWISSSQSCTRLDENQFFSLQVVDFLQELEIKYDCIPNASLGISKCEEFETMVKESRIPLLHLRHNALPGRENSDFLGEPSTGSIIITEPKLGWWFLSVFNPTVTARDEMCLKLKWRARTCGPGLAGDDCQWPVLRVERILTKEFESPFDSYYHPASKSESWWFSVESSNSLISKVPAEQWAFAMLRVADGAAGASLSIEVKTSLTVNTELYARHEGCPSSSTWDFKVTKPWGLSEFGDEPQGPRQDINGSQRFRASKYQTLFLPVVYPMEGYWCIGLKYLPHEANTRASVLHNSQDPHRKGITRSLGHSFQGRNLSVALGDDLDIRHENLSLRISSNMRVLLHGCPNKCSRHGSCQTVYEASRLHLISYCRCDVTHGGFDCSVSSQPLWKDLRQRLLLIFSNAAAILPGIWALRRKFYSEWITYALSGTASAIYHSCDSGGWCAMSYSTLQFLDFWLSFVAIIMTCLLIAGFHGPTKAMLHIACAILTAAVAKEDATSGWSVLVVVLISSIGLLLGWGLETQKISSLRLRWSASTNGTRADWLQWGLRVVRSFYMQLRDRFHWPYLWLGLAFLVSALVSNLMELPQTYWIFHSWWHIGIYTSAFILLYSIRNVEGALPRRAEDLEGYQRISTTSRQDEDSLITDSHAALVSELNSFPENHIH